MGADEAVAALPQAAASEERHDIVTVAPARGLAATLDFDAGEFSRGDALPLLWHWLYFVPAHRQGELGPDGHPRSSGLLPPTPLPRRMWAGTRFAWHQPLRIGDAVTRVSRVASVRPATGRTGSLLFVTLRHELATAAGLCLVEEQDIVYREAPAAAQSPAAAAPAAAEAQPGLAPTWSRELVPDEVLLFRYSALTFNAHRIHYDRRHAMDVEGYPGLVVPGALVATLMLGLLQQHRPAAKVLRFDLRAARPAFANQLLRIHCALEAADSAQLWACDGGGARVMHGRAVLA